MMMTISLLQSSMIVVVTKNNVLFLSSVNPRQGELFIQCSFFILFQMFFVVVVVQEFTKNNNNKSDEIFIDSIDDDHQTRILIKVNKTKQI